MAWNANKNPIEYLEQRVNYYKKQRGQFKRFLTDEKMLERVGEVKIQRGLCQIERRITEFEHAVIVLKAIQE